MRLLTLFMVVSFVFSCSNRIENEQQPEKVKVQFSLGGDYEHAAGLLSARAIPDMDLVAIQVYERTAETGSKFKPYAYGLWDNITESPLNLNKGYIYRFETTIVPNAKEFVSKNALDGSFRQPFSVSGSGGSSKIGNEFIYSGSNIFTYISQGNTAVISGSSYNVCSNPVGDRYYGELDNVMANDYMGTITVNTKRVVFGLKYQIVGFTEGELKISLKNAPDVILKPEEVEGQTTIFTLNGSAGNGEWIKDGYLENIQLTVSWKKNSSSNYIMMDSKFNFGRMKMYNVNIDLTQTSRPSGVGVVLEEEVFTDGGNISNVR